MHHANVNMLGIRGGYKLTDTGASASTFASSSDRPSRGHVAGCAPELHLGLPREAELIPRRPSRAVTAPQVPTTAPRFSILGRGLKLRQASQTSARTGNTVERTDRRLQAHGYMGGTRWPPGRHGARPSCLWIRGGGRVDDGCATPCSENPLLRQSSSKVDGPMLTFCKGEGGADQARIIR